MSFNKNVSADFVFVFMFFFNLMPFFNTMNLRTTFRIQNVYILVGCIKFVHIAIHIRMPLLSVFNTQSGELKHIESIDCYIPCRPPK